MGEFPFRFGTPDSDEQETYEWIESILSVIELQGKKKGRETTYRYNSSSE